MLKNWEIRRVVLSQLCGPEEGNFRAIVAGHFRDLFVVRGGDHTGDAIRLEPGGDAIGHQRVPGKRLDVLARDRT